MDERKLSSPGTALEESVRLMKHLRGPDGCAWDRKQTFDTIMRHTLEETYEVFDAIERRAWPDLKDELGDLLLQVLFYAQMADEAGYFSFEDVAETLNAKLVRRHPHVFGDASANTPEEVTATWEAVKRKEREEADKAPALHLDSVKPSMPATLEATSLGRRAAEVGFDWPGIEGVFAKIEEETDELRSEVHAVPAGGMTISEEFGDLLFTVINLGRHLRLDPEFALRSANRKFRRRFNAMEAAAGGTDALRKATSETLDRMWREAKQAKLVSAELQDSRAAVESHPDRTSD